MTSYTSELSPPAGELEDAAWFLMGVKPQGGVFTRFAMPGEL